MSMLLTYSALYNIYLINIVISFIFIYFAFCVICVEKILVFRAVPGFTDTLKAKNFPNLSLSCSLNPSRFIVRNPG